MIHSKFLENIECLTHQERKEYQEKYDFHHKNGDRCYNDAKNKCWWLPEKSSREWSTMMWNAAIAGAAPGTPMSKICLMLLSVLGTYGSYAIDEWNYINNKLNWAHYHYDLMEFYAAVLAKG